MSVLLLLMYLQNSMGAIILEIFSDIDLDFEDRIESILRKGKLIFSREMEV